MARRKRNLDEESGHDLGMVLTVSLFLILLTFFILLNSISVKDDRRTRLAIGSLVGAFGSLTGGLSPLKTGDSIMPPSAPIADKEFDVDTLMTMMDHAMTGKIRVQSVEGREVIAIQEELLFDQRRFMLKPSSYRLLDKLSGLIRNGDFQVEIAGHTDSRPAEEKGYRSNWEHSSLMAMKVLKYLMDRGGVSPERLTAYGRGSYRNFTSNDTRLSREQNSRVEIILNYDAPEYVKRIYRRRPSGIFSYKKFDFRIF